MIPDSIKRRIAAQEPTIPRADRTIGPGDIRRAESGGEERLVLVLAVHPNRESAQITLVHPYPEYATGSDIIVDESVSGLAYPIVVEAGMRGLVWLKDLGRLVTNVSAEVVTACLSSRAKTLGGPGLSVGASYTGPLDTRAAFKNSERESLARLSDDCTVVALEGGAIALDVDEVFHALLAPSPDAGLMMEAIINLWQTRGNDLVFTLEHVEFLESKGLLDVARWEGALGSNGIEFLRGPLQNLIERALARSGDAEPEPEVIFGQRDLVGAGRHT